MADNAGMEKNTEDKKNEDMIWQTTFDSLSDMVSIQDKDFKLVKANKAFTDTFKASKEELIGKTCYEIIHDTKEPWHECPMVQALNTKKPAKKEFFEPRLGLYLDVSVSPLFDEKGEIAGTIHLVKDITDQKKTEYELQERIKELSCLSGISHLIEKTGDSLEALLQGAVEFMPPAWQYPDIACARIILDKREYATPNFTKTAINQTRPLFVSGNQVGIVEICYLEPTMTDRPRPTFLKEEDNLLDIIAERLGRAIQRKVTENALKESEQKFKAIFDSSRDGIALVYPELRKFYIGNSAFCDMLGYSQDEIKSLGVEDIHRKEDMPSVTEHFEAQIKKQSGAIRDFIVKRKDGSFFAAEISSAPVMVGGRKYMLSVFRDITERKTAEDEKHRLEEKYKETIENIFKFVPEGLLVFTDKLNLFKKNKSFQDIVREYSIKLGYKEEELEKIIIERVKGKITNKDYTEIRVPQKTR